MTTTGPIALDADGHVHEENILFSEYLEPAYRDRTGGWELNADSNRRFVVDGIEHPPFPREISVRKPMTAENRLKVLDKERIRLAVLFPSAALVAGYLEPGFAAAMMRAYNSWISDWCRPFSDRLKFAASIALFDVDEAIREARRAVGDLGAVAVTVRPNPALGQRLDHPSRSTPRSRNWACRWSSTNRQATRQPPGASDMAAWRYRKAIRSIM